MTETPKAPQNPLEFLASVLNAADPKAAHGTGPVVFDLFGTDPRGGNAADELFGLFGNLANAGRGKPSAGTESRKTDAPTAAPREKATEDTSLQIALAGIPKENIFVEVQADELVVKAVVPQEVRVHEGQREIVRRELLPLNVDIERITSTYKDGLLTITLPAIKPTKVRIDISED